MKSRARSFAGRASRGRIRYLALLTALLGADPARAQTVGVETGAPLPRFESLRFDEVRMRAGPGTEYPIRFVYRRSGLPIQVFREYGDWREVRDPEGATGWIKRTQLSGRRTALVAEDGTVFYRKADSGSRPIVKAEEGLVLSVQTCRREWCEVRARGYTGWVLRAALWGVLPDEEIDG